jgi:K+-sensing histidine kinase KdpD
MNDQTNRLKRELKALTEVSKTLTAPLELPDLLNSVMLKIEGVLEPAEAGVIMLWDQSSGLFRAVASFGFDQSILKQMGLRAGESITGKVFDAEQDSLLCSPAEIAAMMADMRPANQQVFSKALGEDKKPICIVASPIVVNSEKYGVLVFETFEKKTPFKPADLPFVHTLADLIALAIDRVRLEGKADVIRQAREAEHMRSAIMATLSHELRLPLTAIKGYTTALLMDELEWSDEKRNSFLRQMDDECDNMQSMIQDMLDTSILDADQFILEFQPVRLQNLVLQIISEVQQRTAQHRFITEFSPNFPILNVDIRWIKQVFRNIFDNAIKYSPEGGLIFIRVNERLTDAVISVADQGVGIAPEDLIPIFEKYFRGKTPAGYHVPGTGLGLPITRAIIEAHGGKIWVESILDQGTTVFFSLPKPQPVPDY